MRTVMGLTQKKMTKAKTMRAIQEKGVRLMVVVVLVDSGNGDEGIWVADDVSKTMDHQRKCIDHGEFLKGRSTFIDKHGRW
jgi:hypothetical protein